MAIVAVVGLIFLFNAQNSQTDLQAARDQGAADARLGAATAAALSASEQAGQATQAARETTARASERAAEAAQAAASQTAQAAQTAGDAAQDATTTEPAPQQ